jgi:hypothetical protein
MLSVARCVIVEVCLPRLAMSVDSPYDRLVPRSFEAKAVQHGRTAPSRGGYPQMADESFWLNPWIVTIGGGAVLGIGSWLISKRLKKDQPPVSGPATIHQPNGGTSIANTGAIGTVNVHPPAQESAEAAIHARYAVRERQLELITALETNVKRTNRHLQQIVDQIGQWSVIAPVMHKRIEENRGEFLGMRAQLAALHRPEEMGLIDRWYEELIDIERHMQQEYKAWVIYCSVGPGPNAPEGWHISPPVKQKEKYTRALNTGGSMAWTCTDIREKVQADLRS